MASADIEKIKAELETLGYCPTIETMCGRETIVIDYVIDVGSHLGEKVRLGFSFQEASYPEYPPHWIHISPPYFDQERGSEEHTTANGGEWRALSRPPGGLWDDLSTKHMKSYMELHVRSFCKRLK